LDSRVKQTDGRTGKTCNAAVAELKNTFCVLEDELFLARKDQSRTGCKFVTGQGVQEGAAPLCRNNFSRATAAPAGTAEARISYGDSVRPSVYHGPVQKQPSDTETPGLHYMLA